METILITGASGLIGRTLTPILKERGYRVTHLSRTVPEDPVIETFTWDIHKQTIDIQAIEEADYIIHLAGAGIADKKWTASRKKEIIDSRVEGTHLIFKTLQKANKRLKAFVSASATGVYGAITSEKIFSETDLPANDFLGITCKLWEGAAETIAKLDIRTVKLRTGVVLSEKGGALPEMTRLIRYFIGSPLGNGNQYIPWIHIDDICGMYIKAIEDQSMSGVYNAVAPEHVTNAYFTKIAAKVLNRPLILPNVPSFLLKFLLGEMASVVLTGSRASCKKIEDKGYVFNYPKFPTALKELLK